MSTTTTTQTGGPTRSTFGNWRQPASPGLGNLGLLGTGALLSGLLVATITAMFSMIAAVTIAAVVLLLLVPLAVRKDGRSGVQRIFARVAWLRGLRRRSHLYRSGLISLTPGGRHTLPGLAAGSQVFDAMDAYGRPFGIVNIPSTSHYSVVLRCDADGAALVDPEQIESWVASWGHWLADLAHEPGLAACAVTIETAPDPGTRLESEVQRQLRRDAPALAQRVMREIVETYPAGSAVIHTRIQLTYRATGPTGRRDQEQMASELATRLPGLTNSLATTGAGAVTPMTGAELAEVVRVAYDPQCLGALERARSRSDGPVVDWSDAGPAAAQAAWDHYRHDSGVSVTWSMSEAPRGVVLSSVLAQLLAPHDAIDRKRVTLIYRPYSPGAAARLVEADVRTATFLASRRSNPAAREDLALRQALQSAGEEASGAGVTRFALLVTATVTDTKHLPVASAIVENLGATARLRLRRVYGSQDTAFAAGLPVGLVLPDHVRIPSSISEASR